MKRKKLSFRRESATIKIILILVLILVLTACQGQEETDEQVVTTSVINTGDIQISAFGSGTLISANEVELEFEYGGVIDQILVETGDYVFEGDLLAVLEIADLEEALEKAEEDLRELTSDAAVAVATLELAESQKDVLTADSTLNFYLSPYIYKAEIRLRDAQDELLSAMDEAETNPSDGAEKRMVEAQESVEHAELSLALNWETYYEEYVSDFFNFPWRDRFGFWHDYYDPPSELEVAEVWAELSAAEARVEEAESFLAALTEDMIPDDAYGSQLVKLEDTINAVTEAREMLEAGTLEAPIDGVVIDINKEEGDQIGTTVVMTIARLDPPTLEASFDESDWSLVQEGNPVEVVFDALDEKTYFGEIIFINPALITSQNTTAVSTLVELDMSETGWSDLPLSSGASIEVIAGETRDAVLLPIEGLQESSGNQGTVLVESGGEFTSRDVKLGLWDVLFVEVLDGLSAGEVVLIGELE
jgi:multidrug efflux pump subunit AcrA (membrane-fusion protein)